MGSITQGIFGGSKAKQTSASTSSSTGGSWNDAYPQLQSQFSSTAGNTGTASNAMSNLLGLGTDPTAANQAFDNYRNSTGYQFKMDQGTQAINSNAATKGLYGSGATLKALDTFGQNTASTSFNDYLSQLLGLGNQGIQAGQLISGAGAKSASQSTSSSTGNSNSSSKPGLAAMLGQAAAGAAASDRRLKKNIEKLYTREDGLNVYSYDYINDKGPYIGVMADEVETLKPEALGPVIAGYATVNYDKLGGL